MISMVLMEVLAFMIIGAFTGVTAGLLGVGGGLVVVPFSLMVFEFLAANGGTHIPFEHQVHVAVATSLATIIFTAVSAIYSQHKKAAIDWSIFWILAPGIVTGAFLGAWLASLIPRTPLLLIFASFIILVGLKMWLGWSPHVKGKLPGWLGMSAVASVIGIISSIVGIGGGTMTVPFLNRGQIPIQRAVAVSSALGLPIALSGSMGFFWTGLSLELGDDGVSQNMMWGYVYLPAFFAIISVSIMTARLGVYWSHCLSKQTLSRVFSLFLMILAIKLYYGVMVS